MKGAQLINRQFLTVILTVIVIALMLAWAYTAILNA